MITKARRVAEASILQRVHLRLRRGLPDQGGLPPMVSRSRGEDCLETLPERTLLYCLKLDTELLSIRLGFHQ